MKTKLFFIFLLLLGVSDLSAQSIDSLSILIEKGKKEIINWEATLGSDVEKILAFYSKIPIPIKDENTKSSQRDDLGRLYSKTIITKRELWYFEKDNKFVVLPKETIVSCYEIGKDPLLIFALAIGCLSCGIIILFQKRSNSNKIKKIIPILYTTLLLGTPTLIYINPRLGGVILIILLILLRREIGEFILKILKKIYK